jgi:hypothetical protein
MWTPCQGHIKKKPQGLWGGCRPAAILFVYESGQPDWPGEEVIPEFRGRHPAEPHLRAVVVVVVDVGGHLLEDVPEIRASAERELVLGVPEEGLHRRVVPAVTPARHRLGDAGAR